MKVLLDSNILFSGLGFKGPENRVIWLAILGKIKLVISDYILAEVKKIIELRFTGVRKKRAIELLNRLIASETIEIKRKEDYISNLGEAKKLINERDSPILACAMLGDIDVLITGDKDFHTKNAKKRARIMKTREFLQQFL